MACVFGNLGNEALIVTDQDEVFGMGSNGASSLGLGTVNSSLFPQKVDKLCGKGIIKFAYGSGPHVLALTKNGEIFSWGHNGYCQLGNGSNHQGSAPTMIQGTLQGKKVLDVSCGSHHSICVTDTGDIYTWGQNNCGQVGSGSSTNQATPRRVSSPFTGKRVVSISCGQSSTMVVLESGEVYGWGYNGNGQLGIGNNINQLNPCRVTGLQGRVISKVICGYAHTLALTDEGALYAWGANSYGQLGTGHKANSCSPARAALEIGRVVDIASLHYSHISAAITQDEEVYMWGQCRGQSVQDPTRTPFKSLHDVFACYASPTVTYEPMITETSKGQSLMQDFKAAFNDPTTSDLEFLVEGKTIHVHKAVLKIRCEYFRVMFQDHWEESNRKVIEIEQFQYPVYLAFIQYLYTDEVNLGTEEAIALLDLANAYCETELKHRCEALIKNGICVENAPMLFATAIRYNASDLEEFCFRFSLNHMTAVTQTEGFSMLDDKAVKDFIARAAKEGVFKS